MRRLTKNQILLMQEKIIERYGGHPGIRDEGMLDSALSAPFQTFGEVDLFPALIDKAARLGYGLIKNHPCFDGNKRIGAMALLAFLKINQVELDTTSKELADIILQAL